jgi:hypothetical protein
MGAKGQFITKEELELEVLNGPDNDDYDINIIEKCGKVIVVYREKGKYNISHTEVYVQKQTKGDIKCKY